jgi:hypothetical protein
MSQPLVIAGGSVRLFINNVVYTVAQSVSLEVTTGEYAIFGINSPYAQEIAGGGQVSVSGNVKGIRINNSGGVQGINGRPLFSDVAASNYISLRLEDRKTGELLWSVPKAKVTKSSESVAAKGVYSLSFDFIGQIAYQALDLS